MFKVQMKRPIYRGSEVTSTEVQIIAYEPYTIITQTIDGDVRTRDDDELVQLVKEKFYMLTYFNRAEKEYIKQLKEQLTSSKELLKQVQMALFESAEMQYQLLDNITELKERVGEN